MRSKRIKRTGWVASLALVLPFSACNCSEGPGLSRLRASLDLMPTSVDFGDVPLGATAMQQVTVSNKGTAVLHVCTQSSSMSLECASNTRIDPDGSPFTATFDMADASNNNVWVVDKGESRTFVVTFTPQTQGQAGATLIIAHNGSNGPTTSLPLTGSGVAPNLNISPDVLDFGQATVGQKKSLDLTLANPTPFDQPVSLGPIMESSVIFGTAYNGTDTPPGGALTERVPANGSLTVKVWFLPPDESMQSNTLHITYCPTCSKDVGLKGVGVKPAFQIMPSSLDFGSMQIGDHGMQSFVVKNIGNVDLVVNSAGPASGTSMDFVPTAQGASFPATVPPMQTLTIQVAYTPHSGGMITGNIEVNTNAWDDPTTPANESIGVVAVKAAVAGAAITAVPASINFGSVPVGGPAVGRALLLENSGTAPLTITNIQLNSPTHDLTISMMPSLPAMVMPGSSIRAQLAFLPTQAEMLSAHVIVSSSDRGTPMLDVPVAGVGGTPPNCTISVAPALVNFGLVQRGRQATLPVVVHNGGSQPCNLTNVQLTGAPEFSVASGGGAMITVAPSSSHSVAVKFLPDNYGAFHTLMTFGSDDPSQAMVQVPIDGSSAQTDLLVVPSSLDFGVVPVMCSSPDRSITLYNTGANPVTVMQVYLDASTPPSFQLASYPTPTTIAPGQSSAITVRYHPSAVGQETGLLFIVNSASPAPVAVPLSGDGEVNAVVTDTFHQASTPKADVLFVVDNSGSMQWAQGSLSSNLSSFLMFAQTQNIDYHIAVTTTDVDPPGPLGIGGGEHGAFVGSPKIITPQTPNALTAFQSNVNVGTNGSGLERGLEAAYLALSDPQINTTNAGFLRPEATLAVIVVSDDDDTRQDDRNGSCPSGNPGGPNEIPGPGVRPVDFYVNFLRNIKGFQNTSMFSFSAVVEMNECECSGTGDNAEAEGWRYMQVAMQTGGVVASICQANWGTTLNNIGMSSFGLRSDFPLSSQPVVSTIAVSVNGMSVPSSSYSYDMTSNSIIFNAGSVPQANATITVTYSVQCL
jgi:hypothetical protein